jgi:iron complex outermembrane receptor protein
MRRASAAAFIGLLSANTVSTLHAQDVDANGNGTEASVIDSVVVLGTARQDTTALTSTAPVDVITPEQLRETGAVTINQALSKLHPSFNFRVFNEYPDKYVDGNRSSGINPYSFIAPNGASGRFVQGGVTFSF